ncbi:MAG: cation:proton antiporter [Thermoplasmata archaeon]|nr:cation:proton antiporter [Thermoplasmata archaeon]
MALPFAVNSALATFAIILVLGLFLPEIAQRWKISTVPFYIIAGMLAGPFGLGLLQEHEALSFIGELGLYFLVFIAGLEVYRSTGAKWKKPVKLAIIFSSVCFFAGFTLGQIAGYGLAPSLLIGTILVSSSVGEIIPIVNSSKKLKERAGHVLIPGVVILDTLSLLGIALLIQHDRPPASILLLAISMMAFLVLGVILIPQVARWYFAREEKKAKEGDLKFMIAAMLIIVALSEIIHLHGIVAAFFAGLLIGRSLPHRRELHRIEGIGHALLIPVFFVVLGMETNIRVLWTAHSAIFLALGLLATLFISKLTAGAIYGVSGGYRKERVRKGLVTGVIFWPQLSATIAATVVGKEAGLVDEPLFVAVIFMAIVSATITPFIVPLLWKEKLSPLGLREHVVLIGAGAMGSVVLEYLLSSERNFVVIEEDMEKIKGLREEWIPYVFGDGGDQGSLRKANVAEAGLVVLCIGDDKKSEKIVRKIKHLNPECRVIVRVHDPKYVRLLALVEAVIRPESLVGDEINRQIERLH